MHTQTRREIVYLALAAIDRCSWIEEAHQLIEASVKASEESAVLL